MSSLAHYVYGGSRTPAPPVVRAVAPVVRANTRGGQSGGVAASRQVQFSASKLSNSGKTTNDDPDKTDDSSSSTTTVFVVMTIVGVVALAGVGGWYFYKSRKNKAASGDAAATGTPAVSEVPPAE